MDNVHPASCDACSLSWPDQVDDNTTGADSPCNLGQVAIVELDKKIAFQLLAVAVVQISCRLRRVLDGIRLRLLQPIEVPLTGQTKIALACGLLASSRRKYSRMSV